MKNITLIHMQGCPYCANARKAMEEIKAAEPKYAQISMEEIDETKNPELTKPYAGQYYYVPSMFVDGKKIYEAKPGESYEECKAHVAEVFAAALA